MIIEKLCKKKVIRMSVLRIEIQLLQEFLFKDLKEHLEYQLSEEDI